MSQPTDSPSVASVPESISDATANGGRDLPIPDDIPDPTDDEMDGLPNATGGQVRAKDSPEGAPEDSSEGDTESSAEEQPPAEPPAATPEAPFEVPVWVSLDEVKVDALPESMRPLAQRLLDMGRTNHSILAAKVAAHDAATKRLNDLVDEMAQGGDEQVKPLAERAKALESENETLVNENAGYLMAVFNQRVPYYDKLPQAVRDEVARTVESSMFQSMPGTTTVDKMEAATKWVMHRQGVKVPEVAAPPTPPVPPVKPPTPTPPAAPRATGSAVTTTGPRNAPAPTRKSFDQMSRREILDAEDDLLKDFGPGQK